MELTQYHFPPGAVACEPGDHVSCETSDGRSELYRVEDLVLLRKLYRVEGELEPTYFEAERLVDSAGPGYPDEIHVLLRRVEDPVTRRTPVSSGPLIVRAASAMPTERYRNRGKSPESDSLKPPGLERGT